jgi:hypothetical protein
MADVPLFLGSRTLLVPQPQQFSANSSTTTVISRRRDLYLISIYAFKECGLFTNWTDVNSKWIQRSSKWNAAQIEPFHRLLSEVSPPKTREEKKKSGTLGRFGTYERPTRDERPWGRSNGNRGRGITRRTKPRGRKTWSIADVTNTARRKEEIAIRL